VLGWRPVDYSFVERVHSVPAVRTMKIAVVTLQKISSKNTNIYKYEFTGILIVPRPHPAAVRATHHQCGQQCNVHKHSTNDYVSVVEIMRLCMIFA
jgi:hypothetical protein